MTCRKNANQSYDMSQKSQPVLRHVAKRPTSPTTCRKNANKSYDMSQKRQPILRHVAKRQPILRHVAKTPTSLTTCRKKHQPILRHVAKTPTNLATTKRTKLQKTRKVYKRQCQRKWHENCPHKIFVVVFKSVAKFRQISKILWAIWRWRHEVGRFPWFQSHLFPSKRAD